MREEGQKDLRMEKKFAQGSERGFGACLARSLGALLWQYIRSIRSAAWRLSTLSALSRTESILTAFMNELMDVGREERAGDEIGWSRAEKFKKGERRRRRARINSKQFHPLLDLATSVRVSRGRAAPEAIFTWR